jgi:hypothetical protein
MLAGPSAAQIFSPPTSEPLQKRHAVG